ncbi:MAG: hypothetical protein M3Z31_17810 [Pseudomonadota bacterium]|nr:hypothetical protein [Pseudomonadota bacterium]
MISNLFDMNDLAALSRALIPWLPAQLQAFRPESMNVFPHRTKTGQAALFADETSEYSRVAELARASRAAYFAEWIGNAAKGFQRAYASVRRAAGAAGGTGAMGQAD